jgi:hypothetical protein
MGPAPVQDGEAQTLLKILPISTRVIGRGGRKPIGGGNKKSAAIGVAHPTGGSCGTFGWSLGDSGVRIIERRRMRDALLDREIGRPSCDEEKREGEERV